MPQMTFKYRIVSVKVRATPSIKVIRQPYTVDIVSNRDNTVS